MGLGAVDGGLGRGGGVGPGARVEQVDVEPAGVQMPRGRDQHGVAVGGPLVELPPLVGMIGLVGVGERAVRAAALQHVEHRIDVTLLHVHPDRPGRGDLGCPRR